MYRLKYHVTKMNDRICINTTDISQCDTDPHSKYYG